MPDKMQRHRYAFWWDLDKVRWQRVWKTLHLAGESLTRSADKIRMAHDYGCIVTARYGLAWHVKLWLSVVMTPRLFQAVRDNLIQGYANNFALEHFSQNGMLEMRWLEFKGSRLPTFQDRPPSRTRWWVVNRITFPLSIIPHSFLTDHTIELFLVFLNKRAVLGLVQMGW